MYKSDLKDQLIRCERLGTHFLALIGELGAFITEYAKDRYNIQADAEIGSWDEGMDLLIIRFKDGKTLPPSLVSDLEHLFKEARIVRWTIGS